MNPFKRPLLAAALVLAAAAGRAAETPAGKAATYRLLKTAVLGGEGGWDYLSLDGAARRLYVAHATKIEVVDVDTLKPVGAVEGVDGAHGAALAPELGRGFATAGKGDKVVIFDLKTLKPLGEVKTGAGPDAVVYEPTTRRVFSFNGKGRDITVIDAAGGAAVGAIPVGGRPEFAVADGGGKIYANVEDTSELIVIDAAAMKVTARWPLAPCEEPSGLALDKSGKRLFAVCSNKLMAVVDAASGKLVATVAIGDHADAAAYDPAAGAAFSSNGEGTLTVVRLGAGGKYEAETAPTRKGARTMALDEKTGRLFLATAEFGPAPAPTKEHPKPRPTIVPGSFALVVVGR
jgi:DNA-binding beta-propeller fold protein YncE